MKIKGFVLSQNSHKNQQPHAIFEHPKARDSGKDALGKKMANEEFPRKRASKKTSAIRSH